MPASSPSMAEQRRSPTELLQAASGFLAAFVALVASIKGYLGELTPFVPGWFAHPIAQQGISASIVGAGLFLVWTGLRRRSRLLRPDALVIMPGRQDHLVGREDDVQQLRKTCSDKRLVFLIGESGAGKTALLRSGLVPASTGPFHPVHGADGAEGQRRRRGGRSASAQVGDPGEPVDAAARTCIGGAGQERALWRFGAQSKRPSARPMTSNGTLCSAVPPLCCHFSKMKIASAPLRATAAAL